ncbi:MAG: hypothetical protein F6K62_07210 [Sphaerospermopsis sp. SIO1G2]|nr:hypothetical protein [Sphaerospermopsis sp. SIO1G1]NET70749.1 hypothetical protein [Sphaerospermopsis sp. SIO1G2]
MQVLFYSKKIGKFWSLAKMAMDTGTLDLITGILGITILIGGMVMMFTTVFTTKR